MSGKPLRVGLEEADKIAKRIGIQTPHEVIRDVLVSLVAEIAEQNNRIERLEEWVREHNDLHCDFIERKVRVLE